MIIAHIAGVPIEETALSLGPVIVTGVGIVKRLRKGRANASPVAGRAGG